MGLLDGILGGAIGAALATAINGLIEKHGGVKGLINELEQKASALPSSHGSAREKISLFHPIKSTRPSARIP